MMGFGNRKKKSSSSDHNNRRNIRNRGVGTGIIAQVPLDVPEKTAKEGGGGGKRSPVVSMSCAMEKTQKSTPSDVKKGQKSPRQKKTSNRTNNAPVKVSHPTSNNSCSSSSNTSEAAKKTEIVRKTRDKPIPKRPAPKPQKIKSSEMLTAESPTGNMSTALRDEPSNTSHIASSGSMDLPGAGMGDLMQTFAAKCKSVTLHDLTREFNSLPDACKEDCKESLTVRNGGKNRYSNIYCLDRSRVVINFLADRGFSQYIHANWVRSDTLNQPFIVTQGPLKRTVLDFWRMIWQQKCEFIIMLCQNMEENRVKCAEYFYSEEGTRLLVNPLEVITLSRTEDNGIVTTKLEVRFEDKRLLVTHLLFPNWPDHQAPYSSFGQLYLLLDKVRSSSRPVVVHCSAGVGRSGTFVALEMCLMDLAHHRNVDVFNTVRKLRTYRCMAVQTLAQYMSIYMGILYFGKQNYCISSSDMSLFIKMLSEYHPVP